MKPQGIKTKVKLRSKFSKVREKLHNQIVNKLEDTGRHLSSTLRDHLAGEGSGNFWDVPERLDYGYSSSWYQASAPYEYPAERTGVLMNSIEWDLHFGMNMIYRLDVGTDVEYAEEVEAKRPYLTRVMIEEYDVIVGILSRPMVM